MASRSIVDLSEDDFELVDSVLPIRTKSPGNVVNTNTQVRLDLQPIKGSNQILLTVQPPRKPAGDLKHTSCDIVLVIDVSGSMRSAAELPDQAMSEKKESSGLSILDLVKHASMTILEKLDEHDRLAIVTFSNASTVVQGLLPATKSQKINTATKISHLRVENSTNLWAGIREGLDLIDKTDTVGNIQQLLVLTDGAPNFMCPSQGYVKKLGPVLQQMRVNKRVAPTISTFGFGYHLRSTLLQSIAEVGKGNFAFIPDAGMIGTVFVHAVANLFSTYGTNAEVELVSSNTRVQIRLPSYLELDAEEQDSNNTVLHLGNIQYGQSRDVVMTLEGASTKDSLYATIRYQVPNESKQSVTVQSSLDDSRKTPQTMTDYHLSRHELCTFLSTLSTKNAFNEYVSLPASSISPRLPALSSLTTTIETRIANATKTNPKADVTDLAALLADLKSPDPTNPHGSGQIPLALQTLPPPPSRTSPSHSNQSHQPAFYDRWGRHYLPSILHAHMRQLCTTFKDPGPLRYGVTSPMFNKFRVELDEAFDRIPAPRPSLPRIGGTGRVDMTRYSSIDNPCFAGYCLVKCYDGTQEVRVDALRVGDVVDTPKGGRMISSIVKTDVQHTGRSQVLCGIGKQGDEGLWITPFHPVFVQERGWVFPGELCGPTKIMEQGSVYSILLEKDDDPDAHALWVGGVRCVTLGHGMAALTGDSRNHPFFGDYDQVVDSLNTLDKDGCGRCVSGGVHKSSPGIVDRFVRLDVVESVEGRVGGEIRSRL